MGAERHRDFFVTAFKDTTIPVLAAYVRNLSKPEVRLFYGAPVLILVFAAPGVVVGYDCALAAENMMLAAHSLGIGSCWIGLAKHLGEDKELLKEAGEPKAPTRNTDVIYYHFITGVGAGVLGSLAISFESIIF